MGEEGVKAASRTKVGDSGFFYSEARLMLGKEPARVWLRLDEAERVWRVEGDYAWAEFEGKIPARECERAVAMAVTTFAGHVRYMLTSATPEQLAEFVETLKAQDRADVGARAKPEAPPARRQA